MYKIFQDSTFWYTIDKQPAHLLTHKTVKNVDLITFPVIIMYSNALINEIISVSFIH